MLYDWEKKKPAVHKQVSTQKCKLIMINNEYMEWTKQHEAVIFVNEIKFWKQLRKKG